MIYKNIDLRFNYLIINYALKSTFDTQILVVIAYHNSQEFGPSKLNIYKQIIGTKQRDSD